MFNSLKLAEDSWYFGKDGVFERVDLENFYSESFITDLNSHSFQYKSDYSNEIFLYYYVEYKELESSLDNVREATFSFSSKSTKRSILVSLSRSNGLRTMLLDRVFSAFSCFFKFPFLLMASFGLALVFPLLLLVRAKSHSNLVLEKVKFAKNIFLVRSNAGYSKAKRFILEKERSVELWDDFSINSESGESIYVLLRSFRFFRIYFKSIRFTARDFFLIFRDAQRFIGGGFRFAIFSDYWKRIPHKALYEACLDEILKFNVECTDFYSGEKEDRFALLQTRACRQAGKRLNCLPHGLEYGFKFPGGLCGDRFYCFSDNARSVLSAIYNSSKFVYSDKIVDGMLDINGEQPTKSITRICFFTEPRDQKVNFEIIDVLIDMGVEFSIKLHPLESADLYKSRFPHISVLPDLRDALKSSVCLARKSTVLVEAAQRGSRAVAILINQKDRFYADYLFPSLSSDKISKAYCINELRNCLIAN